MRLKMSKDQRALTFDVSVIKGQKCFDSKCKMLVQCYMVSHLPSIKL